MNLARFEALLKESMGLDTPTIGASAIERALRERAAAHDLSDLEAYWLLLESSHQERQELIEAVVVPETWFFRDRGAFSALAGLARTRNAAHVRILSIPCSTGEEPYSIAMTLLDAALQPAQFSIDAVDISARALESAARGVYRKNSFRGGDQSFRDRYFDGNRIADRVRAQVRFHQSNLFAAESALQGPYDVIFCRNLLIYFDRQTQDRAVSVLKRLLAKTGVLFVGPSETGLMLNHGFEAQNWPLAFAFRLRAAVPDAVAPVKRSPRAVRASLVRPTSDKPLPFAPRSTAAVSKDSPAHRAPNRDSPSPTAASGTDLLEQAKRLADSGDIAAATKACEAVIRDHGASAAAHYLLGLLSDSAGARAKAIEHYRRAIYLDPKHREALLHLAIATEQAGDLQAARRLYQRAERAGNSNNSV